MNVLKKIQVLFYLLMFVSMTSCTPGPFDPEKEIRIFYENPMGCDEVSGTVMLKATVTGEGAPVPAQMRYEIRTSKTGAPLIFTGYPPEYEAVFDSTQIRDGYVYYRAVPVNNRGKEINLKGFPYFAKGFIPNHKGFMINNGQLDLSMPLVIMGAPLEADVTDIDINNVEEKLMYTMMFGASLMNHLRYYGFIPEFCFDDRTTVVVDPFNPSTEEDNFPVNPYNMLGEPVAGNVRWNPGTLCNPDPFFEIPVPNGIPDMWQYAALDYLLLQDEFGGVASKPEAIAFFRETVENLTDDYNVIFDWFSMFELEKPVAWSPSEDMIQKKLEENIQKGASSVLIYDFYHKANEFEMSSGSWPLFQDALDKANARLGTSVKLGAIQTNDFQLMHYEEFYKSLYLSVKELVTSSEIPDSKRIGIIIAAHGSSTTNRLYDVSNIVNNPIMEENIERYFNERKASIHASMPEILVCYSEYANDPLDGVRGVGEQVRDWVEANYDYIFVFPMEWPWETMEIWEELREGAVEVMEEIIGEEIDDIFDRDENERSRARINNTILVVGESIFTQRAYNPEAYDYLQSAATKLLEDRMIDLTEKNR